MRAVILITAAALTTASCTRPVTPPGQSLSEELAGRVAGQPQSCIPSTPSQNLRIIDAQTIAYNDGPTIWVNHLGASCPGIEPLSTIIVEPNLGTQYCRGDHIRGLEQGANIPGPVCFLGEWVPYRRP